MNILSGREIIFEFKASGNAAQVCAIDCATGTEVFVTTPVKAARADQQALALRKLTKALSEAGVITSITPSQEKGGTSLEAPPTFKRGFLA